MPGADEIMALARDFDVAAGEIPRALYDTFKDEGEHFADDWSKSAGETFGTTPEPGHQSWRFHDSITSEPLLALTNINIEVGPENHLPQGFLGRILEFGGEHSAAYLLGLSAMEKAEPRLEKAADSTIGFLLP